MKFHLPYADAIIACVLFVAIFLASWLALKCLIPRLAASHVVDIPNERSSHQGVVPRGGGLVIVFFLLLAILAQWILTSSTIFFPVLGLVVVCWASLSWYDDKYDLPATIRFVTQFVIALLVVYCFGWIAQINDLSLGWLGIPISVIGIVWLANLYNFMDGIDGIAASQAIVASLTLMSWFYFLENHQLALICLVLAASSYGFLLWNWQPARVFMGDVGSITLGGFFATIVIIGATRFNVPVLSFVILFAVFVYDSTFTLARRVLRAEKVWQAHRQHAYQRYAQIGFSHAQVVIGAIFLMVICSSLATLSIFQRDMIPWFLAVIFLLLSLLHILLVFLERKHS